MSLRGVPMKSGRRGYRPDISGSSAAIVTYLVAIAGFVAMAFLAHLYPTFPGDTAIFGSVQGLKSAWLDSPMGFFTSLGTEPCSQFLVVAAASALLLAKAPRQAVVLVILTIAVAGSTAIVKELVDRARPFAIDGFLSFPSGHTTFASSFFGFLAYLAPQVMHSVSWSNVVRWACIAIAALIAVSRVYLGQHWPSDIVGGVYLAGLW